jgi:hypothetical protein
MTRLRRALAQLRALFGPPAPQSARPDIDLDLIRLWSGGGICRHHWPIRPMTRQYEWFRAAGLIVFGMLIGWGVLAWWVVGAGATR